MIKHLEAIDFVTDPVENNDYLEMYLSAKQIEGCSDRTLACYRLSLNHMMVSIQVAIRSITTETIRKYLIKYQAKNNCSKVTLDNVRRNLSSFFSWLEDEDYIIKNPIRRIHKVKIGTTVKKVISDENIEILREGCRNSRDLAIVDLLFTTGILSGCFRNGVRIIPDSLSE